MKHKHHKIIFKNGQRIRTNELVTYTVEEHAAEHKRLYEIGGHWKDYVAWKGLSGQIKSKDVIMEVYRQNGRANVHHLHTAKVKKKSIKRTKEVNTGRKLTPEHIAKTRRTGQKQPESQKIKVSEALSKEHIIITPDGEKLHIKNLRKFARQYGLDQGNLTRVAQGKLKQHKGYTVFYR
jgi:hypothetical protein